MELFVLSEKHKEPSGKLLILLETYTLVLSAYLALDPINGVYISYNFALASLIIPQLVIHANHITFESVIKPVSMRETAISTIDMLEKHQLKLEKDKDSLSRRVAQREIFKEILLCKGDITIWKRYLINLEVND